LPSMLKKRDRAFECFHHCVGATKAAHPSAGHIEDFLKRVMPFPICTKQINRQDEPLITTILRRFKIVSGYSFLQFQECVQSSEPLIKVIGHRLAFCS
jgi:hypothetical protein